MRWLPTQHPRPGTPRGAHVLLPPLGRPLGDRAADLAILAAEPDLLPRRCAALALVVLERDHHPVRAA